MQPSKINNFDLIRLLAAVQVLVVHTSEHLHLQYPSSLGFFFKVLTFFPGVPVFFTISGFLILWSYERNRENRKKFYFNRLLRIYPALWVCLLLTVLLLLVLSVISVEQLLTREMLAWLVTQATVFQFYTPEVLRSFGVGTPNGSLWTISLELQFYLVVPLVYSVVFAPRKKIIQYLNVFVLCTLSVVSYVFAKTLPPEGMPSKLMGVFLLPYLYSFLFGIWIYKEWELLKGLICNKGLYWLVFYLLYCEVCSYFDWYKPSYWPGAIGLGANLILAFTVISIAYTANTASEKLLKGNDFSYGIYIYHMLVVNVFVHFMWTSDSMYLGAVFLITFSLAVASWFIIERPCLRFKSRI